MFLSTFGASLLATPLAADAQQNAKVYRVGLLGTATPTLMAAWLTAFREGLRERGYVETEPVTATVDHADIRGLATTLLVSVAAPASL
jgi:hypothetical protein